MSVVKLYNINYLGFWNEKPFQNLKTDSQINAICHARSVNNKICHVGRVFCLGTGSSCAQSFSDVWNLTCDSRCHHFVMFCRSVLPVWIMYLMGGLDRYIGWHIDRDIGRCLDRYSTDTRSIHDRYVDRVSVEYLPTLGRHTTDIPRNCRLQYLDRHVGRYKSNKESTGEEK